MDVLKRLEDLDPIKPYHGFASLDVGFHEIEYFRSVKNKFAKLDEKAIKSVLVELEDQVIFLPKYICARLNETDLCELNSSLNKKEEMFLYFGGKHEQNR